jgi:hypothetical protein
LSVSSPRDTRALLSDHIEHLNDSIVEFLDESGWAQGLSRGPNRADSGSTSQHVSELRERLESGPILERPEMLTVHGVFYPAVLMTPGVWERSGTGEAAPPIDWHTPLQEWLFSGFEQWAPSWDLNESTAAAGDRPLFGQLGSEDEAFSLLVVVKGESAGLVRRQLLGEDEMVCSAELRCALLHRGHARASVPERMRRWGKTFDYCLLVDLAAGDRIDRLDVREGYSGYLWECVSPTQWLGDKEVPDVEDAFFVWEHTDLASREAREYGLAALRQKHAYIEQRFGELELIQKSAPIVPGVPRLASESFLDLAAHGSV